MKQTYIFDIIKPNHKEIFNFECPVQMNIEGLLKFDLNSLFFKNNSASAFQLFL